MELMGVSLPVSTFVPYYSEHHSKGRSEAKET